MTVEARLFRPLRQALLTDELPTFPVLPRILRNLLASNTLQVIAGLAEKLVEKQLGSRHLQNIQLSKSGSKVNPCCPNKGVAGGVVYQLDDYHPY